MKYQQIIACFIVMMTLSCVKPSRVFVNNTVNNPNMKEKGDTRVRFISRLTKDSLTDLDFGITYAVDDKKAFFLNVSSNSSDNKTVDTWAEPVYYHNQDPEYTFDHERTFFAIEAGYGVFKVRPINSGGTVNITGEVYGGALFGIFDKDEYHNKPDYRGEIDVFEVHEQHPMFVTTLEPSVGVIFFDIIEYDLCPTVGLIAYAPGGPMLFIDAAHQVKLGYKYVKLTYMQSLFLGISEKGAYSAPAEDQGFGIEFSFPITFN